MNRPIIVAIDFDGTIVTNNFPNIGNIRPEAEEFIKKLKKQNGIFILWTCRTGTKLDEALSLLREHNIYPDEVNSNWKSLPFETSNKIYADIYIDDRSVSKFNCDINKKLEEFIII